jgi:hypothetical protein
MANSVGVFGRSQEVDNAGYSHRFYRFCLLLQSRELSVCMLDNLTR